MTDRDYPQAKRRIAEAEKALQAWIRSRRPERVEMIRQWQEYIAYLKRDIARYRIDMDASYTGTTSARRV